MNWACSSLDPYRLVSNSDAHSPPMLGREATVFDTDLDYFAMAAALRTGKGLEGTIEFFPEEGKYHLDGHRKCDVRVAPEQTRELDTICPQCGKPLTVRVARAGELGGRAAVPGAGRAPPQPDKHHNADRARGPRPGAGPGRRREGAPAPVPGATAAGGGPRRDGLDPQQRAGAAADGPL